MRLRGMQRQLHGIDDVDPRESFFEILTSRPLHQIENRRDLRTRGDDAPDVRARREELGEDLLARGGRRLPVERLETLVNGAHQRLLDPIGRFDVGDARFVEPPREDAADPRAEAAQDQSRPRAPPPQLLDDRLHEGDQSYVAAPCPRENAREERMGRIAQGDDVDRASRRGDVTDRLAQSCFERTDDRHVFRRDSGLGARVREHCPCPIGDRTGLQEKDLSTLSENRARPGEAICSGERSHASEEHERRERRAGGPECEELDREILVAHLLAPKPPLGRT